MHPHGVHEASSWGACARSTLANEPEKIDKLTTQNDRHYKL